MKYVCLISRVLFSLYFYFTGIMYILETNYFAKPAAALGLIFANYFLIIIGIIFILGATGILIGYKVETSSIVLFISLLIVSAILHPFWKYDEIQLAILHLGIFLRNIGLAAACLLFFYFGSGDISVQKQPFSYFKDIFENGNKN